jgi:hypothetical protein
MLSVTLLYVIMLSANMLSDSMPKVIMQSHAKNCNAGQRIVYYYFLCHCVAMTSGIMLGIVMLNVVKL